MNRLWIPSLAVALLLVVPAVSQDNQGKVEDMETTVTVLMQKVEAQDKQLKEIVEYLQAQKAEAKELHAALLASEADGFTFPAPNTDSRVKLLKGLQKFSKSATVKVPGTKPEDEEKPE